MSIINENERRNLITSMEELLDEYDYSYSDYALHDIIDEWEGQKADLITAFKKHPNYLDGQFMIAFDTDYERTVDVKALKKFQNFILNIMSLMVDNLPEEINHQRIFEGCGLLPDKLYWFVRNINQYQDRTINEDFADTINELLPQVRAHVGQKTTRVVNKIFSCLNYNQHPEYNREFAKYADALSPMVIRRHTILSLNPLDYLTMSFGNSWSSCHTIDKANKRGMPNSYQGAYSSGTMSYMLDPSSMVFYTVDSSYEGQAYWSQPKINRQMFHYGEEKLVQGRLYPQDNDGCKLEYDSYRHIVQEIMATILDIPNLWSVKSGTGPASEYIISYGTHYRDYCNFSNCTLSRIKGSENENDFQVGAEPICIECGETHNNEECINCCNYGQRCADCGRLISYEDDECWVDGECYCRDCVSYCDYCESYHRSNTYYVSSDDMNICEYCYDQHYIRCDECGNVYHYDDITYVEGEGDICRHCLEEHYTICDRCGEYYSDRNIYNHEGNWYCEDCYNEINEEDE